MVIFEVQQDFIGHRHNVQCTYSSILNQSWIVVNKISGKNTQWKLFPNASFFDKQKNPFVVVTICSASTILALGERWVIKWHFRQPFPVTWVMTVLGGTKRALSLIRKRDAPFPFSLVVSLQNIPGIMDMTCDLLWYFIGQFTHII